MPMTRKEKQKRLLESLGLNVRDRIKITQKNNVHTDKIFVIRETKHDRDYDVYYLGPENVFSTKKEMYSLSILIDMDWEQLEIPLKDKTCDDIEGCVGCPLHNFYCAEIIDEDLSDITVSDVYHKIEKKLFIARDELFGGEK